MFDWNEANMALLKDMLEAGLSGGQIAARLGISRSAAIGKVARTMDLAFKNKRSGKGNGSSTHVPRKHSKKEAFYNLAGLKCEPLPPPPVNPEVMELLTIVDLGPWSCRFPVGEVGHPDFRYCGNRKAEDTAPYCPHHMKVTHTDPALARRRDYSKGFTYHGPKA